MFYANMDGALGSPKAILADGSITAIITDIALAVAQVYHNFDRPEAKAVFKKGIQAVFGDDGPTWTPMTKAQASYVQCTHFNVDELRRQMEELSRE